VAALVVAMAVAMWPACMQKPTPTAPAGDQANLDFVLKDMNGAEVRLADFKGRPLVLNFWATWCGPCKVEIPAFVELVEQYKDQRLAVLGISVDDSPEDLRKFAEEFKMNYPVLVGLGQDTLQETYQAMMVIPVTWFIRPDGTVLKSHTGPATKEWFEEQIKALLPPASEAP
jgi:peroxiredoxin